MIREAKKWVIPNQPLHMHFMAMFHMSNDSHLFADHEGSHRLPLYEAKLIHQFDHRWATDNLENGKDSSADVTLAEKQNPAFTIRPRYWVDAREVYLRTAVLPKGLLQALREQNAVVIILSMCHLLFGKWILAARSTNRLTHTTDLFPAWCDFINVYPFARAIAPTQLGLCGNNPACLKALGSILPSCRAGRQNHGDSRRSTAWYAVDAFGRFGVPRCRGNL